jgi:hydrogenase-4 component B
MPATALAFAVGAVAICGLPPLNGFVSEFLIYLGLFRTAVIGTGGLWVWAAFAAPALALIGALAASCFVKAYGAVFLGSARSEHAKNASESKPTMIGPMLVLVLGCVVIGLSPPLVAPMLEQAAAAWSPGMKAEELQLSRLAPLDWLSVMGLGLALSIVAVGFFLRFRQLRGNVELAETWGCGYAAPSPKMQYTSSSFADMLVRLFAWVLRPRVHRTHIIGIFPRRARFASHLPDVVLDGFIQPACRSIAWVFSRFRVLQQGSIHVYLSYVFIAMLALLLWSVW